MDGSRDMPTRHHCEGRLPEAGYGPAIDSCQAADGKLWVGNGEYASQVAFCPFCGFAAEVKPEVTPIVVGPGSGSKWGP